MYENGRMIPLETGVHQEWGDRIKENDGGSKINYDIL
jgi:hypothetical protein